MLAQLNSSVRHGRPLASQSRALGHGMPACQRLPVAVHSMPPRLELVRDVMSSGALITVKPSDNVDAALELLVENRITGLPVVDDENRVVGVVSDFDLLALDSLGRTNDSALFPKADQTWQTFKEVRVLLSKSSSQLVVDVMTSNPLTATPTMSLNEATSILLEKKVRRLPVVDEEGKLVGVLSRGNIVRAAMLARKAAAQN